MHTRTLEQHTQVIEACKVLFEAKNKDYDTSWRIMRLPSCTDQLLIKAKRIRTIQEKGVQKVGDGINTELIGIINYGIIALIQIKLANCPSLNIPYKELAVIYDDCAQATQTLLTQKNHDYGEIWRDMRVSSLIDIILMKIFRIKKIEDNQGKTLVSEGVEASYQDIINYAVFCLIKRDFLATSASTGSVGSSNVKVAATHKSNEVK